MTARRLLVVVVALSLLAGACSQGERKRLGDALAHSAKLTTASLYAGRISVSLRPKKVPTDGSQQLRITGTGTLGQLAVTLDRGRRRAAFSPAPGAAAIVLFDASAVYARRVTRSTADRRKWARFEYERLPDVDVPSIMELSQSAGPGDIAVLDPVFITDLLAGVLTGSIKLEKTDADGGRLLSFNTSISKAERKLKIDESDRKERKKLLRSLAITGDIQHGEAILRKDGTIASLRVAFASRPDKLTQLDFETTLTLVPATPDDNVRAIALPSRDVTVRVPALATLKGTIQHQLVASGGRL
jgi:hypothetical protein